MTEANYSNGDYYHYTYDAVGNRKTQTTKIGALILTISYNYDHANRLMDVDGVEYDYDDNGNLLNDGVNGYEYDSANRLIAFGPIGQTPTSTYAYNGLGDRLQETVNSVTTTFTMDLNMGLTQALSDGANTYIYGNGRIAQAAGSNGTEYFLGDALGSVRQLTNANGAITYTKAYDPYGAGTSTTGSSQSAYGYTNEYTSQGLIYLRSRYYSGETGRFLTKDTWVGDYNRPLSFNGWNYVEGNPINRVDPSGHYFWGPGDTLLNSSETRFQSQNIQVRIQQLYMASKSMKRIHAEYIIPGTNFPVDLLDSVTGEMWEIKPWDQINEAGPQLTIYLIAMTGAHENNLLRGTTPIGTPYDWNTVPALWFPGESFPAQIYVGTDDTGYHHIFAGQVDPGVIAWWKYKTPQPIDVPYPIYIPANMKWNQRNKRPGWVPQPGTLPGYTYLYSSLDNLEYGYDTLSPMIDCQEYDYELPDWLINILENIQLQFSP